MLKLEELRKLRSKLQDEYNGTIAGDDGTIALAVKQIEELDEVLSWSIQQLEQRKKNTKTYLVKSRIRTKLLKEHLSKDELEQINIQAREAAEREEEGEEGDSE